MFKILESAILTSVEWALSDLSLLHISPTYLALWCYRIFHENLRIFCKLLRKIQEWRSSKIVEHQSKTHTHIHIHTYINIHTHTQGSFTLIESERESEFFFDLSCCYMWILNWILCETIWKRCISECLKTYPHQEKLAVKAKKMIKCQVKQMKASKKVFAFASSFPWCEWSFT